MNHTRKPLSVLMVLLIIASFIPYIGMKAAADDVFTYTVTAVSGPVTGSIAYEQRIEIMYGEPLVLSVTGNKPFIISRNIMNPEMNCSVTDISKTEKTVTISAKKQDSYAYGAAVELYFLDENNINYKDSTGNNILYRAYMQGEPFHVKSVKLNATNINLVPGQTFKLIAELYPSSGPADVEQVRVDWESNDDNEEYVAIAQDGTVTAKAVGNATIYAFPRPKLTSQVFFYEVCYVHVVSTLPAESVAISVADGSDAVIVDGVLTLAEGDTAQLRAVVTPENSTDTVSWTADDSGVATVDASGTVTAVSMGSSVITAQAGEHTGTLTVRVLKHHETVPAACTSAGSVEYWEDANGVKYSDKGGTTVITDVTAPMLGHDWELVTDTPATCEADGEKTYVCKNDSSHTKTEKVDKLGHKWDEGAVTKPATCEAGGEKTYTCKNDSDHKKTEKIPALGHKWDGGKVEKPATRHEAGVMKYICLNDPKHTKTEEIPIITDTNGYFFVTSDHTYVLQSGKKVLMKVDHETEDDIIDKFEELLIDGKTVDKSKYKKESGSVKLTLDTAFLDTLKKGTHTVTFNFEDGYAESTLKIKSAGSGDTPGTGDETSLPATAGAAVSFLMAALYIFLSVYSVRRTRAITPASDIAENDGE